MSSSRLDRPVVIATRGSALALTQARTVQARFAKLFPELSFKIEIFKTTGDQLQSRPPQEIPAHLPKGLFTKELEVALLEKRADLAVHSLKDLPTEFPDGLTLTAVSPREDVREVLLSKRPLEATANDGGLLQQLPDGGTIGTGSPRRQAFIRRANPALKTLGIRGNVPTRIKKLSEEADLDAIILAAAGLNRLGYQLPSDKPISGLEAPTGIFASFVPVHDMVPCVGQGAIGLETRADDLEIREICDRFNDLETQYCTETERHFLAAMGGGCQTPVAAYARVIEDSIHLIAANVAEETSPLFEEQVSIADRESLAKTAAEQLRL